MTISAAIDLDPHYRTRRERDGEVSFEWDGTTLCIEQVQHGEAYDATIRLDPTQIAALRKVLGDG